MPVFKRHPLLATVISLAVIESPQWLSSVWALFTSEPLVPVVMCWLQRHDLPAIYIPAWVPRLLGITMLAIIGYQQYRLHRQTVSAPRTSRRAGTAAAPPTVQTAPEPEAIKALARHAADKPSVHIRMATREQKALAQMIRGLLEVGGTAPLILTKPLERGLTPKTAVWHRCAGW